MTWEQDWDMQETLGGEIAVRAHAAAFYVSLLKAGFLSEAADFAEWYLEEFDHDLEN